MSSDPKSSTAEVARGPLQGWHRGLPVAIVVTATFIAYAAALGLGFVGDDRAQVVENASIRSWRFLPLYFSTHVWGYAYPHLLSNYYRPVFLVWLRLNEGLFGLSPRGWHLTSVLTHVAVTALVYCLARRLGLETWGAAVAALVFGLHPAHVEAVAYVSAAPELISAFFLLAAFLAWLHARQRGSHPYSWVGALAAFGVALLAKESAMALPIFVALYAAIYIEPEGAKVSPLGCLRAALAAAAPFLAVALAYVPLRVRALHGFAHAVTPVTPRVEFLTLPSILFSYLRLLFWPRPLSLYYDLSYLSAPTSSGFFLPLAGIFALLGLLMVWYLWTYRRDVAQNGSQESLREGNCIAFASLWMLVAILPVLDLRMLPRSEILHDRYLYLPSVGFAILVGAAITQAIRAAKQVRWKRAVAALTATVCLVLGLLTVHQTLYWFDDFSLSFHAHEIAPNSVAATTNLGAAVAQRGIAGPAMELYRQALALQPDFWRANVNLAYLYYAQGNIPQAANYFARACNIDPTDGDQFLYLGMALLQLGRPNDAERAIRTALLVRPQGSKYHLGLAMVLKAEGKLPEAAQEAKSEIAEDPKSRQAQSLLKDLEQRMESVAGHPDENSRSHAGHQDLK